MILELIKRLNLVQQIVYPVILNQEALVRNNLEENRARIQKTIS